MQDDLATPEVVQELAGRGRDLFAALHRVPASVTGGVVRLTTGEVPESLGTVCFHIIGNLETMHD